MNWFTVFNIVQTSEFTISLTCLILETILLNASQQYKGISSESQVFSGFFGTILLIGVFISGLYCFAGNERFKKSDIGIHSAVGVLWILYTLLKLHYYVTIHISDVYKYNQSIKSTRAWLIHVGYNTYVLTILLGSINFMLYFVSTILLWRLKKENNDNDLEKVVNITESKV